MIVRLSSCVTIVLLSNALAIVLLSSCVIIVPAADIVVTCSVLAGKVVCKGTHIAPPRPILVTADADIDIR